MKAIKLVTGVTPTCWRPPYGDVDVSRFSFLTSTRDRHVFRVQDRIRAIANALGLQTIIWDYDSNDWRAGQGNITAADVDTDYGLFISNLTAGTFNTVGGIMLTHELNNFTMQEAIKWYPQLKASFSVRCPLPRATETMLTCARPWSPSESRSTRRIPIKRPTIPCRRTSSVRRNLTLI